MELKPGLSAFVTGGASGIGEALCLALGQKGTFVTVVDLSEVKGKKVAALVQKENAKFHPELDFPSAIFVKCDVTNTTDLASAFEKHLATYGGLDICINSAGISTPVPFDKDADGMGAWRHAVNVNLISLIDCTRLAIRTMQAARKPGVIINMGSSSGLYPFYHDPVYAATKGGVVMFTRSLVPFKREGIRVNVLCPEFVDTELSLKMDPKFMALMGGFVPMEMVVKGVFELISDESKAGKCLWITKRRGLEYWPTPSEEKKYMVKHSKSGQRLSFTAPSNFQIPQSFEKVIVHTLSHNFRAATSIVRAPLKLPVKPHHVLVKIIYAGVNGGDLRASAPSGVAVANLGKQPPSYVGLETVVGGEFSSGHYFKDSGSRLPLDAGFEAVGVIAAVGDFVNDLKVGTPAAVLAFGSYAEFIMVPSKHIIPVARPVPEVVAMLTSGLTASIALDKAGQMEQMKSGKVVLVTAAAGGTGQFAVQLAKLAGHTVVATCGGKEKAMLLKDLGVDRVIDYKSEDIKTVLKKEFPKGVDIIYESVGGEMFDLCLNALAVHGRLIVIGMISQYQGEHGWKPLNYTGLCEKILKKSLTLAGFYLLQYTHLWQEHLNKLIHLFSLGKLKVAVDPKSFLGLNAVADAVEHLHSGKSVGKVVVCVDPTFGQQLAKL